MKLGTILLIFMIPALGIAALLWSMGFEISIGKIIFPAGSLILAAIAISRRAKTVSESRPIRTRIIGARVGDGIGELMVEARSSSAVSRLSLPVGCKIRTVEANRVYLVEIPQSRRPIVEEIARENGYRGEVG